MTQRDHEFLAIDFETADYSSNSACSIGLVRVKKGSVIAKEHFYIRPPSNQFRFTHIHGIRWIDVANAPSFGDLWPTIAPFFQGVDFVVAHNVGFDRRVLASVCADHGIVLPNFDYRCTVQMARKILGIQPANLPFVCQKLEIELRHHDALSDALACARIAIKALEMV